MARMASSELLPGAASPWIFTLGTLVAGERWGSCRAVHREKAGKGDHVALFVADVVGRKIFDRRPPGGIRLQDDLLGAPPVREVVNVLPAPVGTYGRVDVRPVQPQGAGPVRMDDQAVLGAVLKAAKVGKGCAVLSGRLGKERVPAAIRALCPREARSMSSRSKPDEVPSSRTAGGAMTEPSV